MDCSRRFLAARVCSMYSDLLLSAAMQVVPALSKLFASNDRTIRRSLLESIDSYGAHFAQVSLVRLVMKFV